MILTKAKFAERRGVAKSCVSNWIQRGHLTPPALRADGRINVELADQQLGVMVDLVRSLGQTQRPRPAGFAQKLTAPMPPTENVRQQLRELERQLGEMRAQAADVRRKRQDFLSACENWLIGAILDETELSLEQFQKVRASFRLFCQRHEEADARAARHLSDPAQQDQPVVRRVEGATWARRRRIRPPR